MAAPLELKPTPAPVRPPADLLLLLAAAVAVWFSPLVVGVVLPITWSFWVRTRPPRREIWIGGSLWLSAVAVAWILAVSGWLPKGPSDSWQVQAKADYRVLWTELSETADQAVAEVSDVVSEGGRTEAHRRLRRVVEGRIEGTTLLLIDPDGEAVAWSGRGLVHEPEAQDIPRQGPIWWTSFGGSSLGFVRPLDRSPRPWRVLAGRSFSSTALPIGANLEGPKGTYQWSLVDSGSPQKEGVVRIEGGDELPQLAIRYSYGESDRLGGRAAVDWSRVLLGFTLMALAVMRGIGVILLTGTALRGSNRKSAVILVLAAGLTCMATGLGASPVPTLILVGGVVLGALGLLERLRLPHWLSVASGAVLPLALFVVCYFLQEPVERLDLVDSGWALIDAASLRLGLFGMAVAVLTALGDAFGNRFFPETGSPLLLGEYWSSSGRFMTIWQWRSSGLWRRQSWVAGGSISRVGEAAQQPSVALCSWRLFWPPQRGRRPAVFSFDSR